MSATDGEKREESKNKIKNTKNTKKHQKTPKNTKTHQKTPKPKNKIKHFKK